MFAEELDGTNFHHGVLFSYDLRLVLNVVVSVPVSSGGHEVAVLHFDQLADNLEANDMKLLRELLLVKHLEEGGDNRGKSQVLKGLLRVLVALGNDILDFELDVGDPENELLKLFLDHVLCLVRVLQLNEHCGELGALRVLVVNSVKDLHVLASLR